MAFGKLIWIKEDQGREEFLIARPDTGLGRQSTNDIQIDHPSVSRYHARLQVADGGVFIVDLESAQGTFVNDQQISPDTPALLNDGDHIYLGSTELAFSLPSTRRIVNLIPEASLINAEGIPFSFRLDEPQQTVAPGARLQLEVMIENESTVSKSFRVTMGGLNHDWVSVLPRAVRLGPGASGICTLTVKPPRTSETRPGRYALSVRVEDEASPKIYLETVREIDVSGFTGFGISTRSLVNRGEYRLSLKNYGNQPTCVRLRGEDLRSRLNYHFDPAEFHLAAGASATSKLTVTEKRGRLFSASPIPFRIIAQSVDQASFQAPVSGSYTPRAQAVTVLKYGGIATASGVVLALVAAIIAFFLIDPFGFRLKKEEAVVEPAATAGEMMALEVAAQAATSPTSVPLPMIHSFTAEPMEIVYRSSEAITFTWEAADYDSIHLLNWQGSNVLAADDISTGQAAIDGTRLPTGNIDFTLKVWDDRHIAERTLEIQVRVIACQLREDAAIFASPEQGQTVTLEPPASVFIIGREAAILPLWAAIAHYPEDALLSPDLLQPIGWVPYVALDCEEDIPLENYLVLE